MQTQSTMALRKTSGLGTFNLLHKMFFSKTKKLHKRLWIWIVDEIWIVGFYIQSHGTVPPKYILMMVQSHGTYCFNLMVWIVTFIQSPSKQNSRGTVRQTCLGNSNFLKIHVEMMISLVGYMENIWQTNGKIIFFWGLVFSQLLLGMKQFFFLMKPPGLTLLWRVQRCGNANRC